MAVGNSTSSFTRSMGVWPSRSTRPLQYTPSASWTLDSAVPVPGWTSGHSRHDCSYRSRLLFRCNFSWWSRPIHHHADADEGDRPANYVGPVRAVVVEVPAP